MRFCFDHRLELDPLIRFILTVRKGYRPVAYHNWSHAFSVAHTMAVIIKGSSDVFTCEEVIIYEMNIWFMVSARPSSCGWTREVAEHERSMKVARGNSSFTTASICRRTHAR